MTVSKVLPVLVTRVLDDSRGPVTDAAAGAV